MAKKILIIEDDEFFRELVAKKLSVSGFAVSESVDGKKGLERARDLKPDLILLDLLLPKMDGYEVLSLLKGDPKTAQIPVVILSNLSSTSDIEKGLKLGASDFLIKSQFASEEIIEKINTFL